MSNAIAWTSFERDMMRDDASAAEANLAAGQPVYYRERDTPDGLAIRENPDGRRELIRVTDAGEEIVVSGLK